MMVQHCFVMEVLGLARPILGKRRDKRRENIANRLRCQLGGDRYVV